eukprot:scaffold18699_cov125-Cylindrotheca_fusiformis.AAC.4
MIATNKISFLCLFIFFASVAIAAPIKQHARSKEKTFLTTSEKPIRVLQGGKAGKAGKDNIVVESSGTNGVDKDISYDGYDDDMSASVSNDASPSAYSTRRSKKSSKSNKSSKSSKKSKLHMPDEPSKSTKKGSESPASVPSPSPTSSPNSGQVQVQAGTFSLFFTLSDPQLPSSEDFAEVTEVTRSYLEDYMKEEYGEALESFLTFNIFQEFQPNEPVQCDYRSVGLFDGSSGSLPSFSELESQIDEAFSEPQVQEYLDRIKALSSENPFSSTQSIDQDASASTSSFPVGVTIAGVALLLLAAGAIVGIKRRSMASNRDIGGKLDAGPSSEVSLGSTISLVPNDFSEAGQSSEVSLVREDFAEADPSSEASLDNPTSLLPDDFAEAGPSSEASLGRSISVGLEDFPSEEKSAS